MTGFGAWKVFGWGATALALALTQGACGGTGSHAREGAGAGGTGATGGTTATGGSGASMAGTGGSAGTGTSCSSVGGDVVIATFDEGATIVERNYPIAMGAMPGGTYSYGDPTDTTMVYSTSVVAEGHQCQALAISITGTSFRGAGLWTTAAVDATSYTGIAFWARRGAGSTDPTGLVVSLGLDAVTPASSSGSCMGTDADCVRPKVTISLTDTWTQYALDWSMFTPGSAAGTAVAASGEGVNGLDFSFQLAGTSLETTVLELDDVVFLTSSP